MKNFEHDHANQTKSERICHSTLSSRIRSLGHVSFHLRVYDDDAKLGVNTRILKIRRGVPRKFSNLNEGGNEMNVDQFF